MADPIPDFDLEPTTTPGVAVLLLGVDEAGNPCGMAPTPGSASLYDIGFEYNFNADIVSPVIIQFDPVYFPGVLAQWTIVTDVQGTVVIDVLKAHQAPPGLGNSIVGDNPPTLTNGTYNSSGSFTDWNPGFFAAGDVYGFAIRSATTARKIRFQLVLSRNS